MLEELDKSGAQSITRVLASVQPHGPVDNVLMLRPKYNSTATDLRDLFRDEMKRGMLKKAFSTVYGPAVQPKLGNVLSPGETSNGGVASASTSTTRETASSAAPASTMSQASTATHQAEPATAEATTANSDTTNGAATNTDESPAVQDVDDPTVQMFRNLGGQVTSVEPN